ncbi:SRPBCC family protein [Mycobacterium sp.]|uniref:SRPBCC family protein n=1 Tax=Mycobacterium sp. TaxID=1785 RepID=UPI0031CFF687
MLGVDRVIAAPAPAVWEVFVDVDAWPAWGPSIRRAALDPPHTALALHATGTVYTPLGVALPFVVTEFAAGRLWAWAVAGVAATRHRVQPMGERTRVSIDVPWWAGAYLPVCAIALRRIERMLTPPR